MKSDMFEQDMDGQMWQTLDISEMARVNPSPFHAGTTHSAEIFGHLRDFSVRQLPDEALEIIAPQDEDAQQEVEPATVEERDEGDTPTAFDDGQAEMTPFSLDEADGQEAQESAPVPAIDIEAIKEEAFAEGREAARAEYEQERTRLVEANRLSLIENRQTVINSLGADLVGVCTASFAQLQSCLQEKLARLIAPLVEEKLTREAAAEFVQMLGAQAIEAQLPLIIEGDPALLNAFVVQAKNEPALNLDHYQLEAQEGSALKLIVKDQVLSTRLSPLLQQLREII